MRHPCLMAGFVCNKSAPQDAHDAQRKTASQSRIGAKSGANPLLIGPPVRALLTDKRSNKKVYYPT